jgi:hypothetical protein
MGTDWQQHVDGIDLEDEWAVGMWIAWEVEEIGRIFTLFFTLFFCSHTALVWGSYTPSFAHSAPLRWRTSYFLCQDV